MANPFFNDPAYGWQQPQVAPWQMGGMLGGQQQQPGGILGNYAAAPPQAPQAPSQGGMAGMLDPQVALPIAAALLGGRTLRDSLAGAAQAAGPAVGNIRKRAALNAWLKAKSSGDPAQLQAATDALYQADPSIAESVATAQMTPHPMVAVAPGSRLADPWSGKFADGGGAAPGRGDGSPYDIEQANKAYEAQFGPPANRATDAPDFQAWYKAPSGWSAFGLRSQSDQFATPLQADQIGAGGLPKRGASEADTRRGVMAANAIAKNYIGLPIYNLVANGGPMISRIDVAAAKKGSAADQELLDSAIKLATGGGQITEAQVGAILHGSSAWDKLNVAYKYVHDGGILSNDQKKQIQTLAHGIYAEYQKQYQPVYDKAMSEMDAAGVPKAFRGVLPDLNFLSRASGAPGGNGRAPAPGDNGLPSDPLGQARDAIARGAPRAAVMQRLQQNGIDPSGL